MATAQRVFYETVAVLAFLVLLVAAWLLSGHRAERRLQAAREDQRQELESRAEEHQASLRRLAEERRSTAAAHRRSEAEAVFRGYAAGLQPAALERWRRFLGASRDELTRTDPKVAFIHLFTPSGSVLTSTDPELTARGKIDETADWALAAEGLITRPGEGSILELAGPILANGSPIAYLWLGYDVGEAGGSP